VAPMEAEDRSGWPGEGASEMGELELGDGEGEDEDEDEDGGEEEGEAERGGVVRGGKPCCWRTMWYAAVMKGRKSGLSQALTASRPWSRYNPPTNDYVYGSILD
jgi:hypothetical protein